MGFGARTGISNTLVKDYCSLLHVSPFVCGIPLKETEGDGPFVDSCPQTRILGIVVQ